MGDIENMKLVGHCNPVHFYPAPVCPIGKINEIYYTTLLETNGRLSIFPVKDLSDIKEDCSLYTDEISEEVKGFKFKEDKLYAFSENDLIYFPVKDLVEYYKMILEEGKLDSHPFARINMAKVVKDERLIIETIPECLKKIKNSEMLYYWYKGLIEEAKTTMPELAEKLNSLNPLEKILVA